MSIKVVNSVRYFVDESHSIIDAADDRRKILLSSCMLDYVEKNVHIQNELHKDIFKSHVLECVEKMVSWYDDSIGGNEQPLELSNELVAFATEALSTYFNYNNSVFLNLLRDIMRELS